MKRFLFIIPLTPPHLLSPLRKDLFSLFISALQRQAYENWEGLLFGEDEKADGKIKYIKTNAVSKEDKFLVAVDYLKSLNHKPDYVVRIDDEDLISPYALKYASQFDFDCYADKYHTFYDITTGKTTQNKREWLPNTIIHKFEHVLEEIRKPGDVLINNDNVSLLGLDHDIYWEKYYRDKKILWSDRSNPIYLRILSPTSITSQQENQHKTWNNKAQADFNQYVKGYGPWVYKPLSGFGEYDAELKRIWEKFSGAPVKKKISASVFFDYLKYYYEYYSKKASKIYFSFEKNK